MHLSGFHSIQHIRCENEVKVVLQREFYVLLNEANMIAISCVPFFDHWTLDSPWKCAALPPLAHSSQLSYNNNSQLGPSPFGRVYHTIRSLALSIIEQPRARCVNAPSSAPHRRHLLPPLHLPTSAACGNVVYTVYHRFAHNRHSEPAPWWR